MWRAIPSEEEVVVYQALYGEFGLWVRPLSMFCEEIEVDGEHVPRFALIQAEVSPIGASQV